MKKFLTIFSILFVCIVASAQDNQKKFSEKLSEATATLHEDSKEAISTVYNDGKNVVSTLYNDGKDLASVIYPDVKSAISSIAKAIGVAAEHVYKVLVKSYVVKGAKELVIFVLGLIFIFFCGILRFNKFYAIQKEINWKVVFPTVWIIAGAILLFCVDYNTMLMGLINPEFGAIDYILQYTKTVL